MLHFWCNNNIFADLNEKKNLDIFLPQDHRTRENRGFGFVRYFHKDDAEDAIDALDGRRFDGR